MKLSVKLLGVIALASITASAASAGIIFSDNWNDNTVQNPTFSASGADWVIEQGAFSADGTAPPSADFFNPEMVSARLMPSTAGGTRISVNFGLTQPNVPVEARFKLYQRNGAEGGNYTFIFGLKNTASGNAHEERAALNPGYYGSGFHGWVDYGGGVYNVWAGTPGYSITNAWNYLKMTFDPASGVKIWLAVSGAENLAYDDPSLTYTMVAEWINYWPLSNVDQFYMENGGVISWYIDDLEIDGTLASGSISGTIVPADYTDKLSGVLADVTLTKGQTVTSSYVRLDDLGNFTIPDLAVGNYDVSIKATCWLRKLVGTVAVNAVVDTNIGQINLVSGDIDGDNEVTSTDLSILGLNLGMAGD